MNINFEKDSDSKNSSDARILENPFSAKNTLTSLEGRLDYNTNDPNSEPEPKSRSSGRSQRVSQEDKFRARLFVKGIDLNVRAEHLHQIFSKYGELKSIMPRGNYAIIDFSQEQDMRAAIKAESGLLKFNDKLANVYPWNPDLAPDGRPKYLGNRESRYQARASKRTRSNSPEPVNSTDGYELPAKIGEWKYEWFGSDGNPRDVLLVVLTSTPDSFVRQVECMLQENRFHYVKFKLVEFRRSFRDFCANEMKGQDYWAAILLDGTYGRKKLISKLHIYVRDEAEVAPSIREYVEMEVKHSATRLIRRRTYVSESLRKKRNSGRARNPVKIESAANSGMMQSPENSDSKNQMSRTTSSYSFKSEGSSSSNSSLPSETFGSSANLSKPNDIPHSLNFGFSENNNPANALFSGTGVRSSLMEQLAPILLRINPLALMQWQASVLGNQNMGAAGGMAGLFNFQPMFNPNQMNSVPQSSNLGMNTKMLQAMMSLGTGQNPSVPANDPHQSNDTKDNDSEVAQSREESTNSKALGIQINQMLQSFMQSSEDSN